MTKIIIFLLLFHSISSNAVTATYYTNLGLSDKAIAKKIVQDCKTKALKEKVWTDAFTFADETYQRKQVCYAKQFVELLNLHDKHYNSMGVEKKQRLIQSRGLQQRQYYTMVGCKATAMAVAKEQTYFARSCVTGITDDGVARTFKKLVYFTWQAIDFK